MADVDQYRDTADEVLDRPEFREEEPNLLVQAAEWFFRELGEFLGSLDLPGGGAPGGSGSAVYLVGYVILGLLLIGAVYLAWRVMPGWQKRVASDDGPTTRTEVSRTRAEWLARAEEAERAGDWDGAVHARYHALTTGLADAERLSSEASTTSGEHRRRYREQGVTERVPVFDRVSDRYEVVWFGGVDAEPDDAKAMVDDDLRLLDRGSR